MGRHNDSGRNHPRGKATVCRPCNENKDARAECWHWQVLAGFDPQWPNLIGTQVIQLALSPQPVVAVEEIMPRAIKTQQVTENTTVSVVITAVICLILIVAAMEAPIKFVLP